MAEDYYKTLGVSKTATADEIRKAYRKLARVNHPDAKPNDPKAAERFKEIQDAYDVLNDTEKRQQYDQFGHDFQRMGPGGPGGGGAGPGGFGGFNGGSGQIDLGELFGKGGVDFSEFFGNAMEGGPAPGGARKSRRGAVRGEDVRASVQVSFETAVKGGSVDVQINRGGIVETLGVKIPAAPEAGEERQGICCYASRFCLTPIFGGRGQICWWTSLSPLRKRFSEQRSRSRLSAKDRSSSRSPPVHRPA